MGSDRNLLRTMWIAAGVSLVLGVWMTARTLAGLSDAIQLHTKRVADLRAVEALAAAGRAQADALRTWTSSEPPPPLSDVLRREDPDLAASVHDLEPGASLPGWQIRRAALTLTNTRYDRIADAVRVAGTSRPPWTLAECSIAASDQPGVAARIELTFETAERTAK